MGCRESKTEQDKANDIINKGLRDDRKKMDREIKMLLLGTGESGKSTIAKQLRILHMDGFNHDELVSYQPVITNNLLVAYKNIITATVSFGNLKELMNTSEELKEAANFFMGADPLEDELSPRVGQYVKLLWASPLIQATLAKYSHFQLPDSTFYLTQNIDRLCSPGYIPSTEDVLRCRVRTTGIVETQFEIDHYKFRIVDVGGQRSERKKWIHAFEGVTAIIFCVALNEYDQKLFEDEKVNRMHEAVQLFEEVCNSEWFGQTDIILFLNKDDLFKEKIKKVDLNVCFPEYSGGKDYEKACEFIEQKFVHLSKNQKQIFSRVTCATDTKNIETVFNAAKSIILHKNLSGAGFV